MKISNRLKIIISMLIWGTVGVFVKGINLSSMQIVLFRSIIGSLFLIILGLLIREKINVDDLKANLKILIFSGVALGINWVLLFESFKNTTISNATLTYYLAPIFIIVLSVVILKESITPKKLLGIVGAMIGLFLILKFDNLNDLQGYNHVKGILYGIFSAVFYAIMVILNKFIKNLSGLVTTISQLVVSAFILLPFTLFSSSIDIKAIDTKSLILLLIVGIFHTGIALYLYLSSIKDMRGQSIAILSYIDPIFSLIISWAILGEQMNLSQKIGGFLILSSAYFSEHKEENK